MKILITGCAGFIGYNLAKKLLLKKINVVGIDNFDNRTGANLKKKRYESLKKDKNKKYLKFYKTDITNKNDLNKIFKKNRFKKIIHLAALAGVRNSFLVPEKYVDVNIIGSFNILENAKKYNVRDIILASTSSVYGKKMKFPLKEKDNTDLPLSLYAATKKSMEVIAHVYSQNFNVNITILRFFTVYGPFGRPDMALFKFANNVTKNKPINLFNKGNHTRDFTYVDDTVNSILKVILSNKKRKKFEIYNVSNNKAVPLMRYVREIEINIKKKIKKRLLNLQPGDIHKTHGSNLKFKKQFKYTPKVNVSEGVKNFINWFKNHHKN